MSSISRRARRPGTRQPVLTAFHAEAGQFIGKNWLSLRPVPGLPLRPGTTYAAVVTSRVRGAGGESVSAPADLERLLDRSQPDAEPYRSAWVRYGALRSYLEDAPLSGQVVQATVFTTSKPTETMTAMREVVYSLPAAAQGSDVSASARRAGAALYQALRLAELSERRAALLRRGGDLKRDGSGRPQVARTESLRFALSLPNAEMPASGWPVILYAHGTGGDYLTFVREGLDTRAAFVELPDGKTMRMAMIGIDQVLHGPRDPQHSDPEITFFNMQNLDAARDNVKQGRPMTSSCCAWWKTSASEARRGRGSRFASILRASISWATRRAG